MDEKVISQAVIGRLPRYYRYLGDLRDSGVERISSQDLSRLMKVTASQIRQDFNNFGGFGQQGYGYNVEYLYNEIAKILGLNSKHNLIIIGAGNLGQALANYMKGKELRGIPVRPVEQIADFVKANDIDIAVLTIPKDGAVKAAETLVKCNIKAIWNFAHVDLNVPDSIVVENVHLSDSLMKLSYGIEKHAHGDDK